MRLTAVANYLEHQICTRGGWEGVVESFVSSVTAEEKTKRTLIKIELLIIRHTSEDVTIFDTATPRRILLERPTGMQPRKQVYKRVSVGYEIFTRQTGDNHPCQYHLTRFPLQ